jgi:hypothetical protein
VDNRGVVDDQAPPGPAEADTPWPQTPADPDLLDPAADPPPAPDTPKPLGAEGSGVSDLPGAGNPPAAPERPAADDGDVAVDSDHEQLRRLWLAGFDRLATTRPGCPRCGSQTTTGALPAPRRGVIDLQMSIYTLMGLDELPAELSGFGPLLADIARQVLTQRPDLQWKFSVYNEIDDLVAHGVTTTRPTPAGGSPPGGRRTRRRPTTQVAAHVRARNRTCVAPGCRRPAKDCDLDHTVPWPAGGESEPGNLGPACRGHHLFKHSPGSQLVQINPGVFGWQTPKGMQYLTTPTPPLYTDSRLVDPHPPDDP